MEIKYFDNAATTKVGNEVLKEMFPYLREEYGNPSSMYSIGRKTKKAIENARRQVASLIKCVPSEIVFTSCGTESNNMAIKGYCLKNKHKGNHIITSKIEHSAVINTCKNLEQKGFKTTYIGVDKNGIVDINELINAINKDTILISIMYANNEIGTIQNIEEIAKIAKKKNIVFHSDCVQACGNIPIDVKKMDIDMVSLSGHKINAPKGVGALYIKKGIEIETFVNGGHQEKNKRGGTENIVGIVGMGKACEISEKNLKEHNKYLKNLSIYYIKNIEEKIPKVKLNGSRDQRLPGNVNFSFKDIDAEELLMYLDNKGICVSSGSACNSGNEEPSHVLTAIGLKSNVSRGAIRVSFGEENTLEDVDYLIKNIVEFISKKEKSYDILNV